MAAADPFFPLAQPLLFDEPGEKFVDGAFDWAEAFYFGQAPSPEAAAGAAKSTALPLAVMGTASMGKGVRRQWASTVSTAALKARSVPVNGWTLGGGAMLACAGAIGATSMPRKVAGGAETTTSS